MQPHWLIFSDLDGTLLDPLTYGFEPARPVLSKLQERGIPVILCSSKTRVEMEVWRSRLELPSPFIAENGSAVVFPPGWTLLPDAPLRSLGGHQVLELGLPHEEIQGALHALAARAGIRVRGFSQMDMQEIVRRTALSEEAAQQARQREYSEPFVVEEASQEAMDSFLARVEEAGLHCTRGGRFHHLMGPTDKGKAVRLLAELFKTRLTRVRTVALGDSPNDFPMLEAADIRVLVELLHGTHAGTPQGMKCHLAPGIGPVGWAAAMEALLDDGKLPEQWARRGY